VPKNESTCEIIAAIKVCNRWVFFHCAVALPVSKTSVAFLEVNYLNCTSVIGNYTAGPVEENPAVSRGCAARGWHGLDGSASA